jgi:hypothetical protein
MIFLLRFSNFQTITTGTTLILTDPRFNVEFEKSTSTYTLRIEDIQVGSLDWFI